MPHILLAPSGTGKTFSVLTGAAPFLVDGDAVIDHFIAWPEGRWWETPGNKDRIHSENWACLEAHARRYPHVTIVFNGRPHPSDPLIKVAAVLPDVDDLAVNAVRRTALFAQRSFRRTRPTSQPTGIDELLRTYGHIKRFAQEYGFKTFRTIKQAVDARDSG